MERMVPVSLAVVVSLVFFFFQATGISAGDSGDLVTAAFLGGVPHPPGYPLYTFLGFLFSKLPLFTVAWRVALLSSVPHAATLGLVAATVKRVTKSSLAAIVAALLLFSNYNFFHYSTTAEVFALFDLFLAAVIYLLVRLTERFSWRLLWALAFVFGLSLTHHHVILFLIPALLFWAFRERQRLLRDRRALAISLILFCLGLLPYVYLPVAGRSTAIVNWDRPVDMEHFLRLVTRRDYGTFVSGAAFSPGLLSRALALKAYAQFLVMDFGTLILLGAAGFWFMLKSNRRLAATLGIAFVSLGPLFFFYASFPLGNRFALGTYERFLLPTYVLVAVFVGLGAHALSEVIGDRLSLPRLMRRAALLVFGLLIAGSVASMLFGTLWRFWGMREDKTAEYLGVDILSGVPNGAIVLVAFDTPLFTTQYVRYALEFRPDVRVIHASRLNSPDYQQVLEIRFPDLLVPTEGAGGFAGRFVEANAANTSVFTNVPFPVGSSWYWVPYGLLYEAVPQDALPSVDAMYNANRALWQTFHDPGIGILSRYPHLMLSDVLNHYAEGRLALGKTLLRATKFLEAEEEFRQAVILQADTKEADALLLLGIAQTYQKKCDDALISFDKAKEISLITDERIPLYQSFTLRDCVGDSKKADELFSQYETIMRTQDLPLDQL